MTACAYRIRSIRLHTCFWLKFYPLCLKMVTPLILCSFSPSLVVADTVMYPGPAARGADEVGVVILHRQVVDRVAADARVCRELLRRVPLPSDAPHRELRPGPARLTMLDPIPSEPASTQPEPCIYSGSTVGPLLQLIRPVYTTRSNRFILLFP